MTAALNLGLLGNNVNTSGQLSLTTGVSGALPVANGGTGAATLTANNVLLGNGTSALQVVAPGTNGNVLTSNGTTWTSSAPNIPSTTCGAVGTYAMCRRVSGSGSLAAGSTVSGSELEFSSAFANAAGSSGVPSGTWRLMGYLETTGTAVGAISLFLRIS